MNHICVHECMHTHTYTHTHYTYTQMHVQIHTYMNTHKHTHTCTHKQTDNDQNKHCITTILNIPNEFVHINKLNKLTDYVIYSCTQYNNTDLPWHNNNSELSPANSKYSCFKSCTILELEIQNWNTSKKF
jgi:hypothetical protein